MKKRYAILPGLMLASLMGCQGTGNLISTLALKTGSMRILINKSAPARSTQARVGDIDHLYITLETIDATATKSIIAADLGKDVLFTTLKPCIATISVEAFSATESIGLATATATVAPMEITEVNIDLTLSNNYDYRGNINLGINVHDGPDVIVTPIPES